jgi:S-sulfo-L-cysteine synthase (O-acetyl-L-serine-dependent)
LNRYPARSLSLITDLVGNTPLLRLRNAGAEYPNIELYAKLEYFNPGGSVKDRPALQIILDAQQSGQLSSGKTLVDATSGNTGVAYAWIGAALGIPVTLVVPGNVSVARKQVASAYGAQLIYSDSMEGSDGAIRHVRKLVQSEPKRFFYADQYSNESNPRAHYLGTGREIWEQTQGRITHFVCGLGTGGTIMGTGRRLKEYNRQIQVIGVEPLEALHGLEGLKHMPSSIIPAIYREEELDQKLSISTESGWDAAARVLDQQSLLVGHSAGAALVGSLVVAQRLAQQGRPGVIVTLFADRGERYLGPFQRK